MKQLARIARWFSWTPSRWLHGILVGLVLGSVLGGAAYALGPTATSFPGKMTLQDGELAARIVAVPLRQVIEEVARLSGAQVQWLGQGGEETVSVEFPALPFSEAMRRLLGEKNFLLFYASAAEGTKLTQIWISSEGKGGWQALRTLRPVPGGNTTPLSSSDSPVHIEESLETLIQTALYDQDPLVRLDAITQAGGYAQKDPGVKAILSHIAHTDRNPQVQEAASEVLAGME